MNTPILKKNLEYFWSPWHVQSWWSSLRPSQHRAGSSLWIAKMREIAWLRAITHTPLQAQRKTNLINQATWKACPNLSQLSDLGTQQPQSSALQIAVPWSGKRSVGLGSSSGRTTRIHEDISCSAPNLWRRPQSELHVLSHHPGGMLLQSLPTTDK